VAIALNGRARFAAGLLASLVAVLLIGEARWVRARLLWRMGDRMPDQP
jgi:hypothetical protein